MGPEKTSQHRRQGVAKLFDRDAKPVPFICMYPTCENDPVRSHSVSRAWLRQISDENNSVVTLRTRHENFLHAYPSDKNPHPEATKFDIYNTKKLSTCYSFCSLHDASLFNQIDQFQDLDINRKSAFLLAYRSVSHDLCVRRQWSAKLSNLSVPASVRPKLELLKMQHDYGEECLGEVQKNMHNALLNDNFRNTRYYAIVIDSVPDILCSGFFSPVDEEHLWDQVYRTSYLHSLDVNDQLALTIMPYQNDSGVIVLSWYGKSRKNKEYIKKLHKMNESRLVNLLFASVFQYMDNFYIRPSFWDCLSSDRRKALHYRFESDLNPNMTATYKSVRGNTTKYVDWSVKYIKQNIW